MSSDPPPTVSPAPAEETVKSRRELFRRKREERNQRRTTGAEAPRRRASEMEGESEPSAPARPRKRSQRAPGNEPDRIRVEFAPELIDDAAEKVVRRLTKNGYEAYLVGGCVRDLLVGHRPKDFDVATSARPEQVRALFRNSRIIGRRFRLVHVLFPGGHVIETATFRRSPPPSSQADDDLLIRSDNVFGEAHEDARRRDFTINALFYDVDERMVLDWVGGMKHIAERTVDTIGDPVVRFQEDPVRILRAIKFAARIDFGIAPAVYEAAVQCRGTLAMAARSRVSEEILRLMRAGGAHRSVWLLWEMGMLDILIPELSAFIADAEDDTKVWEVLWQVDQLTLSRGRPLDDVVLWCALLLEPLIEACRGESDRLRASHDFLEPVAERLNLPRRVSDAMRRIMAMLPRLADGKAHRSPKNALLPLAKEVLSLRGTVPTESFQIPPDEGRPKRRSRSRARKR